MSGVQAVLFDLDGTLLDRASSLRDFLAAQWAQQPALQVVTEAQFAAAFIELDANGHVCKDVVYQTIIERFGVTGISTEPLLAQYVGEFRNHARAFAGALAALRGLRAGGLKLGIITNGPTRLQRSGIKACGLAPLLDTVLISESEGVAKPDPEIFRRALNRLAVTAEASVYVGDNPEADIRGAHNAGMKTIWFENSYFPAPDPAVTGARMAAYEALAACLRTC